MNRSTSHRSKLSSIVLLIGVMGLIGAPAFAPTATGMQNPDLRVSASLTSNGPNPDVAAVGNAVTAAFSVTNNTLRVPAGESALGAYLPGGRDHPVVRDDPPHADSNLESARHIYRSRLLSQGARG